MSFPPDAYLIGAEKAGTTTLTNILEQHSELSVCVPRDIDFFTRNYRKGFDWYREHFNHPENRISLDVSLSYSNAPLTQMMQEHNLSQSPLIGVPERISKCRPDARFVYIIRNPVTRTYSSYWHAVRNGFEKKTFRKALKSKPFYLDTSNYIGQLELYMQFFSIEAFHFIVFEEMTKDPMRSARQVFRFLGLNDNVPLNDVGAKNQSFQYNRLGELVRKVFPSNESLKGFIGGVKHIVPKALHPIVARLITREIPPISVDDRRYLEEYFKGTIESISKITGLSLDAWK